MITKKPILLSKDVYILTLGGGTAFWLANFAISRTPIAAEYRAALSIAYLPMLLQSWIGGLILGGLVSFALLSFYDRLPARTPMLKSVILSLLVLLLITLTIGSPAIFLATGAGMRYFLISAVINLLRILALGMTIGYLAKIGGKAAEPHAFNGDMK
jgi:hypothetical protein